MAFPLNEDRSLLPSYRTWTCATICGRADLKEYTPMFFLFFLDLLATVLYRWRPRHEQLVGKRCESVETQCKEIRNVKAPRDRWNRETFQLWPSPTLLLLSVCILFLYDCPLVLVEKAFPHHVTLQVPIDGSFWNVLLYITSTRAGKRASKYVLIDYLFTFWFARAHHFSCLEKMPRSAKKGASKLKKTKAFFTCNTVGRITEAPVVFFFVPYHPSLFDTLWKCKDRTIHRPKCCNGCIFRCSTGRQEYVTSTIPFGGTGPINTCLLQPGLRKDRAQLTQTDKTAQSLEYAILLQTVKPPNKHRGGEGTARRRLRLLPLQDVSQDDNTSIDHALPGAWSAPCEVSCNCRHTNITPYGWRMNTHSLHTRNPFWCARGNWNSSALCVFFFSSFFRFLSRISYYRYYTECLEISLIGFKKSDFNRLFSLFFLPLTCPVKLLYI